jgi:hypothetical protein
MTQAVQLLLGIGLIVPDDGSANEIPPQSWQQW